MKIVNDLLKIKVHREQQAETALSLASRALRTAEQAVASAEENLKRTHAEHDAKKKALYDDLFSRVVQRTDLDLARSKLEKIDENFKKCETELHVRKENLALAKKEKERKRIQFKDASRIREKYSELSFQIKSCVAEKMRRKEEVELEEIISKPGDIHENDVFINADKAF